ncbi:MAG: AAA domain-containing protein [Gammaproteobacteria bacterium]|nr:AAA domain-containing protein [Gammaproteobacteria bacterium]
MTNINKENRKLTIEQYQKIAVSIEKQLSRFMVGQELLVHDLLVTLLSGGNALLEGVPGLGKTMLIKTLADILACTFSRIQFTPDLMPADIIGTTIISSFEDGQRGFRFEKGPIFANLVLADEINRAAPRTQSALLEAMQEDRVTVSGVTYELPQPFLVLATQNPIEMEGTYPLPEAQIDRFLYKLYVPYPSEDELVEIARRTTGAILPNVERTTTGPTLVMMQKLSKQVPVSEPVFRYAARLVAATQPDGQNPVESVRKNLRVGASPRGLQAIIWGAKVEALLNNRKAVSIEDIIRVCYPALRHRLLLNFEAQAEGVEPDDIIQDILASVAVPKM